MRHKIYLRRDEKGLGCYSARRLIRIAVNAALKSEGIDMPCELSVLLTDDEGIKKLNREFRQTDSATDVLSFPANEFEADSLEFAGAETNGKTGRVFLGDIALSLERAAAQGLEFGHGTKREIQYLTVHSVLHLLGYDHIDEGEMKRQMRDGEKKIMAAIKGNNKK